MRGTERAQKTAPWVAIALAAIGPLFAYLETRSVGRSADRGADEAKGATGAAYRLLVREIERQSEDIDACHERVDKLAEAVEEVSFVAPPREVYEQRAIERPEPRDPLPASSADFPKGDLREALEEAEEEDW